MTAKAELYGLAAEFRGPEDLVAAVHRSREAGYQELDAFSPFPLEDLNEALGIQGSRLPWWVLIGGILGGVGAFLLQYWVSVITYPLNVGGRPLNSWPAFIPVTFEMTILVAALGAVIRMLVLNRLPMPYHPLFSLPRFSKASQDRFFLCIEAHDPQFDPQETRRFLEGLEPLEVSDVAP